MLRHKSPQKRARQDKKRNERNHGYKSTVATITKKILALVKEGDKAAAQAEFKKAQALIDGAATKGILSKNTVARRVSRIARNVASMS
jgi:small subunit ribosomal protein S20